MTFETGFNAGAYSFNFFSHSGYLDHGLASPSITSQVSGADFWHVNADEPSGLDFVLVGTFRFPGSDHRLVWVDARLT